MRNLKTETTRRALLALAATAPALGFAMSAYALPAPRTDSARWETAYTAWKSAHDKYANCAPKDDDGLSEAEHSAWRQLMKTPAPHPAALLWKIEYLWGSTTFGDEYCDAWSSEIVGPVMQDARRLLTAKDGEPSYA